MDAAVEDVGAPDSWEMADLDESMSRLMVACEKSATPSEFAGVSPPKAVDSVTSSLAPSSSLTASVAGERGVVLSEEVLNQVDLFLREALQNPRERLSILRMEQDVVKFIRDPTQEQLEFQHLPTSYLRLAAHRLAQHYYLQSMVVSDPTLPDGSGSKILIRKTTECRLPLVRLADIPVNLPPEDSNNAMKFAIKQRPQKRSQTANHSNANSSRMNLVKSVEERKEEYNRARARIFSSSSDSGGTSWRKPEGGESAPVPESLPQSYPFPSPRLEEKSCFEGPEVDLGIRGLGDSSSTSSSSSRSARSKTEKEPAITRYRPNNKVAIFRDREVDQKDPDYDRSYDRYMQRFDPGFGFNGGPYTMQPLYSPAVNYNTEFPQLATVSHRPPQMSPLEHQPRPLPPHHLRGPWTVTSNPPTAIGYGPPPESMMPPPPPFNPSHVGAHSTSAIYHLHSSHYACPRPGMGFVHPHERAHQPFAQRHQQQPEMSFGIARPR